MTQWCLDFDGADDYVGCGDVPTGGLTALTVECWLRLDADEAGGVIAKWGGTDATREWKLQVDAGRTLSFTVRYATGDDPPYLDYVAQGSTALTLNTWYHVAGVFDAATIALYLDGVKDAEDSAHGMCQNTSQAMEFGRLGSDYAALRLAWVRISDSARYSSTFAVPTSPPFCDANTLAQYDFIEGSGTALNNREGTAGYDGAISGATWRFDAPQRTDLWGTAYERFGDAWTIVLDDVDITSLVALDSININQLLGSNRDTAVFRIEDVTAGDVSVLSWQHVQIWHGGSLEFGGVLLATDKFVNGITMDIVCHCVDWTALLDKRVVADRVIWDDDSALTILKDITEDGYVTEIDATLYTGTGATGLDVECDYGYVGDLVAKLAEASDYYWFVREDEEGDIYLHFGDAEDAAPFALSTSPDMSTTLPLRVYQWSASGAEIVNDFYLVVEGAEGTTAYTTGGTLGDVVTMDDRNVVQLTNSASSAKYGLLSAVIKMGQEEKALYNTAYLTSLGEERITGRIEIRYGGVRPGMTIGIVHSVLDIDDSYLVHAVRIKPLGGSSIRYERTVWHRLELASSRPRASLVKRAA